jgi:hypothetical protein
MYFEHTKKKDPVADYEQKMRDQRQRARKDSYKRDLEVLGMEPNEVQSPSPTDMIEEKSTKSRFVPEEFSISSNDNQTRRASLITDLQLAIVKERRFSLQDPGK